MTDDNLVEEPVKPVVFYIGKLLSIEHILRTLLEPVYDLRLCDNPQPNLRSSIDSIVTENNRPDIFLVNYKLPAVSAYSVLNWLYEKEETSKSPVLLTSFTPFDQILKEEGGVFPENLRGFIRCGQYSLALVPIIYETLRRYPVK